MKKKPMGLMVVVSALLWMLAFPNSSFAQEDAAAEAPAATPSEEATPEEAPSAEDEDEAFLNQPIKPVGEPQAEPEAPPEEATAEEPTEDGEEEEERKRDHAMQGFVSVLAGVGWFLVAPKDDGKDDPEKACAEKKDSDEPGFEGEPVCTGRSVWHLDMMGGFGVLPGFDVFVLFRLGLEKEPPNMNQPNTRQIGAGIKIHSPADGLFKIGFGIAPLFDFSDHGTADLGYDFVIHVPIQAHFDIVPWFGAFVQVAPNISFVTEFRMEFTGGIGVEGRFP